MNKKTSPEVSKEPMSKLAITGFILGIISVFVGGEVGIIPICAIIFGGCGIYYTSPRFKKRGRWMAIIGLILGVVYLMANLYHYGHIR